MVDITCLQILQHLGYKVTYRRAQPGGEVSAAPYSSPPSPPSSARTQQEDQHLHTHTFKDTNQFKLRIILTLLDLLMCDEIFYNSFG